MSGPNGAQTRKLVDPPEGDWGWIIVFYLFVNILPNGPRNYPWPQSTEDLVIITLLHVGACCHVYTLTVAFSCITIINVLTMGILKSFGILSVALQETFEASMEQISWIGSIMSCVRLTAGPIAAIFCVKIGEKQTGILGGAMVSTGLFLSSYIEQIAFLYVTLGLLAGCGFALLSQAAALNTTRYFRRKLSTACAISRSGTGLTFALAPFIQYLLDEYGWQGTILILCGLTLHLIPLGMLNRPIYLKQDVAEGRDWRQGHQKKSRPLEEKKDLTTEGESQFPISHHNEPVKGSALPTWNGLEEPNTLLRDGKQTGDQNYCTPNDLSVSEPREFCLSQEPALLSQLHSTPQPGRKVLNGSSNQFLATVTMPNDTRHKGLCRGLDGQLKSISVNVRNLIDLTLLTNPMFIIYTLCTFFSQLAYFIPYFHLVAKAKALGIEPFQATLLISVAGIVEIVAQLISGYVADRNFFKKYHYHKIYLLFCGAVNLLAPLAKTFPTLMVYIVFFAMFCGGYLTLLLPVLVDFIGNHRIQKGMGLSQFFVGIGCLIGPPAAGALHDFTKNYDASFQLAGSCYFVSFFILFFVPLAEQKLSREAGKRIKDDSNNLAEEDVLPPCPTMKKEYLQLESMV